VVDDDDLDEIVVRDHHYLDAMASARSVSTTPVPSLDWTGVRGGAGDSLAVDDDAIDDRWRRFAATVIELGSTRLTPVDVPAVGNCGYESVMASGLFPGLTAGDLRAEYLRRATAEGRPLAVAGEYAAVVDLVLVAVRLHINIRIVHNTIHREVINVTALLHEVNPVIGGQIRAGGMTVYMIHFLREVSPACFDTTCSCVPWSVCAARPCCSRRPCIDSFSSMTQTLRSFSVAFGREAKQISHPTGLHRWPLGSVASIHCDSRLVYQRSISMAIMLAGHGHPLAHLWTPAV
jgi:hypothetical protein